MLAPAMFALGGGMSLLRALTISNQPYSVLAAAAVVVPTEALLNPCPSCGKSCDIGTSCSILLSLTLCKDASFCNSCGAPIQQKCPSKYFLCKVLLTLCSMLQSVGTWRCFLFRMWKATFISGWTRLMQNSDTTLRMVLFAS